MVPTTSVTVLRSSRGRPSAPPTAVPLSAPGGPLTPNPLRPHRLPDAPPGPATNWRPRRALPPKPTTARGPAY
eukprot:2298706-Lingulodinium_polyedra.AAC.1